MVKPIASPPICLAVPRSVDRRGEDDPDQEERDHGLDDDALAGGDSRSECGDAELGPVLRSSGQDPRDEQHGERRGAELHDPVPDREHGRDPACDEEAERDGRVEEPARDESDGDDHDPDRETVREREVGRRSRVRGASAGNEEQRERADEFGGTTADVVACQHGATLYRRAGRHCQEATHVSESTRPPWSAERSTSALPTIVTTATD